MQITEVKWWYLLDAQDGLVDDDLDEVLRKRQERICDRRRSIAMASAGEYPPPDCMFEEDEGDEE